MEKNKKQRIKEYVGLILAFAFFLYMAMTKLTEAPLWLDETLEYYISKYMTGIIPWYSNNGVTYATNMYERMLGAFQPPLYNFIMYFWLLIADTEWWFRISNVIMSAIGAYGIYKTVKKISSYQVATLSVVIFSCIYQVIYYTQECSEYSMLLMFLPWTLYAYIQLMEEIKLKNMIYFVILCVLSVYTQYGATFVIVPLIISVFWKAIQSKQGKKIKELLVVYIVTFIAAAVPLLLFFVIPQLENQSNKMSNPDAWKFYNNNIFSDFLHMFIDVFRWNTIESITRFYGIALTATILLFLIACYCLKYSKSFILKHLIVCNIFTWILYYIPTRGGIYGRGYFGFRYNIFFIPLWLITIIFMLYEVYKTFDSIPNEKKKNIIKRIYQAIIIVLVVGYCVYGAHQINKRWEKADTRGCVTAWYEKEGYQYPTLVECGQATSFSYYFEHNPSYKEEYEANVIREKEYVADKSEKEEAEQYDTKSEYYQKYLDEIFEKEWPKQMYYFVGDMDTSILGDVLKNNGYKVEQVYKTTSQLYYLYK